MNAIDTNVYVYALDADEPEKQSKALELIGRLVATQAKIVMLWQVAGELLGQLRKWESQGICSSEMVRIALDRFYALVQMRIPTERVWSISFDLRSRFSLSHWDAMLLAACKDAGITTLYSEDMDAKTNYDGLTIVNPFV